MYTNPNQYTGQAYQNAYQYQTGYTSGYGYDEYQAQYNIQQPIPPGEEYPQNNWSAYQTNQQPAPSSSSATSAQQPPSQHHAGYDNKKEDDKKEALAQERKQQNAQLIKQREDYVKKAMVLKRELDMLRNQKRDIMAEKSPQRDLELILKENDKLQDEIQSKMKAIYNVIEMLSSIIKDGRKISELEAQLDDNSSRNRHHHHHHHSSSSKTQQDDTRYNYIHYDPELHWCRLCDEFPKTAKDLLLHLQTSKHSEIVRKNDVGDNTPWHKLTPEPELPTYENAPKKRIPIRGLQFFISAPAWYCKLCDTWIGDLHCASQHLKSQTHFQNYANFVEQNPHWEIEWLKDREKAMSRNKHHSSDDSASEQRKKRRHKNKRRSSNEQKQDKKKKRRSKKRRRRSSESSSSSSSSDDSSSDDDDEEEEDEENGNEREKGPNDKSKSIRVAMRNMKVQSIMNEDLSGKWEMFERIISGHEEHQTNKHVKKEEEHVTNQWSTVERGQDKEKMMLDNLKDRMKQKQELERARMAELEKKKKEDERLERERREKKQREEQEMRERQEREQREREREEYERIRDKERNQVKFKTKESQGRRPSSERQRQYRSRSPSEKSRENGKIDKQRSPAAEEKRKKSPPGPPPLNKRLPFIGRMPLFKNKKIEEKVEKEIKKEDYDIPRQTRFQPGNLARAFLPQPDVVCFPKLSSFPPISAPPPPPPSIQPEAPAPPKISGEDDKPLKAPPAPKLNAEDKKYVGAAQPEVNVKEEIQSVEDDPQQLCYDPNQQHMMNHQYYHEYYMMYGASTEEYQPQPPPPPPPDDGVPLAHTRPLQPPPLPPNDPSDDLALLGMSADDMAAQSF